MSATTATIAIQRDEQSNISRWMSCPLMHLVPHSCVSSAVHQVWQQSDHHLGCCRQMRCSWSSLAARSKPTVLVMSQTGPGVRPQFAMLPLEQPVPRRYASQCPQQSITTMNGSCTGQQALAVHLDQPPGTSRSPLPRLVHLSATGQRLQQLPACHAASCWRLRDQCLGCRDREPA